MKLLPSLLLGAAFQVALAAHAQPPDVDDDYINPDRPGIADGSNVVGSGRFQVETGFQQEYRITDGSHSKTLFIPTLIRIGLDQSFEVRIEGNTYTQVRVTDSAQGGSKTHGFAPTSVGLKYHFVDSLGEQRPSVGAIFRLFPESGSGAFKTSRATGDLRVVADWDFAPEWSLNPNVGVGFYESDDQRLFAAGLFAATLNFNPSKSLNFFVDTGVQSPETKHGRTAMIVDLGTAYIIGRDIQLDFSAGSSVAGKTPPRAFFSGGISKRF